MLMFLVVNIMFIDVKVDFAIPILLLISISLLASDVNRLPRYTNDCTCPSTFPCTDTQAGLTFAFENTIVKDCVLFRYSPFSSLSVTTVLINCCSCCSHSAKITVSSAYLRLLTTLPPIRNPSMSSISLIIIYVYNANKCGDATQPCRTPCLMLIHSLRSLSHRTAAV